MDREKFLAALLPLVGGRDNTSLCEFQDDALYITLKDAGLANETAVAKLPEAASVTLRRGRLTVTFGTPERKEEVPFMANKNTDYSALAKEILANVGGKENVLSSTHCMTRLRLTLRDRTIVDKNALCALDGISGVRDQQGQIQVIIGPQVNSVHEAFCKICPNQEEQSIEELAAINKESSNRDSAFTRITAFIAGIFIPIVPCLAGAGIIQALLSVLSFFGVMDSSSENYIVLNLIQNAVFYFLPFLVALGAAKQFKCNEFFALVMAGILLSPTIVNAMSAGTTEWHFFGLPIILSDCSSTVVPIIFSVALFSYVYRFFEKIIPSALRMMLCSGLSFLVTGIVTLFIFAPFGTYLGNLLSIAINWAMGVSSVLGGALLGGLHLVLVITGTHFIEVPLIIQEMSSGAGTAIMPITAMGQTALVGALAAVILKTKNQKKRNDYSAVMVPLVLGISEPALYGVAVVLRIPLIASMIGGAVGGIIVAVSGFKLTILGVPGIFAPLLTMTAPGGVAFLLAEIVCMIIAFIITWFCYKITDSN